MHILWSDLSMMCCCMMFGEAFSIVLLAWLPVELKLVLIFSISQPVIVESKLSLGAKHQEIKPSTNDKGNDQASEKDTVPNVMWKNG